eukprot:5698227-Amphidinium_carterae.2
MAARPLCMGGNAEADRAANSVFGAANGKQQQWQWYRRFAHTFRNFLNFLGAIGPSLHERQEKLQVRPQLHQAEEVLEELDWPFPFEGYTLEREAAGL